MGDIGFRAATDALPTRAPRAHEALTAIGIIAEWAVHCPIPKVARGLPFPKLPRGIEVRARGARSFSFEKIGECHIGRT